LIQAAVGYSGTPLARKLGIQEGMTVCLLDAPASWQDWLAPLPQGLTFAGRPAASVDLVHAFFTERASLARQLAAWRRTLCDDVVLWISWPKKTAKVATDITEDVIRELCLPLGWVDVKVCAVSEVWSGLKLVVRKELRGGSGKAAHEQAPKGVPKGAPKLAPKAGRKGGPPAALQVGPKVGR
jgi:hypothetical protein